MTEAMPFLQKYDITFLRPPTIVRGLFSFPFCGRFYYIVPHYDIIRVMIILGLWPVAA